MEYDDVISPIKDAVSSYFAVDSSGHDFYHAIRVDKLGTKIALEERADVVVVRASAYLHDLLRPKETEKSINSHVSPEALKEIEGVLLSVNFPPDKVAPVLYAIELHEDYSFGKNSGKKNTIEGLVLQDADRIDASGAIGIARCFMFGGSKGRPMWRPEVGVNEGKYDPTSLNDSSVHHFYDKLLRLKDSMNTTEGKKIAEGRHAFIGLYLEQFFAEWEEIS